MKRLDIEFRTNFMGADFNTRLIYKCKTADDIMSAQAAINDFLYKKSRSTKKARPHMTDLVRRALLGDQEAAKECTAQGIVMPCPCCSGRALVVEKHGTYPGMWSAVCGKCYLCTPWKTSRKEALNA